MPPTSPARTPSPDGARPSRTDVAVASPPARRPGRPLDPHLRRRVIDATREVVVEVGPAQATFTRIARRAGCGVPALQRRWASPRHLIVDAMEDLGHLADRPPTAGVASAVSALAAPDGRRFVRHMLFAAADDASMAHEVDRVLLEPLRARLRDALPVEADAEAPRVAARDAVVEMLHAAALAAVITGRPVDPSVLAITVTAA